MAEAHFVYITDHALSRGIERRQWLVTHVDVVVVVDAECADGMRTVAVKDTHEILCAAQYRVREMVAAKLKSLDKERAKLEKLMLDGAKVVGRE
jgi:hypothetical protein